MALSAAKISSIAMPEHYVRGKLNGKNINDLLDVVTKTHGHLLKEGKVIDWHQLIGKKLKWPFHTSIEVARNPAPVKGKLLKGSGVEKIKKGKQRGKIFRPFELLDGSHRLTVWRRLKQKELPITIKDIKEPSERYLEQYRTNSAHGLRLDKDARDNAVRIAHTIYKITLPRLASETGLDRSSIIRILADKQRKKGERAKTKKGEFAKGTVAPSDMTVAGFIERVQILLNNFPKLADEIKTYLVANVTTKDRSKLGAMVAQVRDIATCLETPLRETTGKGEPKQAVGGV